MAADRFSIRADILPIAAGNWAIVLVVADANDNQLEQKTLQEGYADPGQALEAYLTALTYAAPDPPDMAIYDIGLKRTGELVDQMGNVNDAIPQIIQRLEDVEEAVKTLAPAATSVIKRANPLLAGRDAAAMHAVQPKAPPKPPPPAIRRVPADAAVRVHGSYAGGPMQGRHAGPGAPEPDLEGEE